MMAIGRRYLKLSDACELLGMGKTKAAKWLEEIGAKRKIGTKTVRYDICVIEEVLNNGKCEENCN